MDGQNAVYGVVGEEQGLDLAEEFHKAKNTARGILSNLVGLFD